jgi:hypothetical protein
MYDSLSQNWIMFFRVLDTLIFSSLITLVCLAEWLFIRGSLLVYWIVGSEYTFPTYHILLWIISNVFSLFGLCSITIIFVASCASIIEAVDTLSRGKYYPIWKKD